MVSTIYSTNKILLLTTLVSALMTTATLVSGKTTSNRIAEASRLPPCYSPIYCHGNLLHTIQIAGIFTDSKTFVDMKMVNPENVTLELFDQFMSETGGSPSRDQVAAFVNSTFEHRGVEFDDWTPTDWTERPKFLDNIVDPTFKKFAYDLNNVWLKLGRKMKDEVRDNSELYSIMYVPNPVIVPGGRFLEFYYWDSYWIVKGLLHCEMNETVRGMLSNFASIVDRHGHIPNGGRIYYHMRSHPPLFTKMVKAYLDVTGDDEWLVENLPLLDKEYQFFMDNHTTTVEKDGVTYTLARYYEQSSGPRPESYKEDWESAQVFNTDEEKGDYYRNLKAAAESGWDFSSRWFIAHDGTNKGNLTHTKATEIIAVELNAILYGNAILLAEFHNRVGNKSKAEEYLKAAEDWEKAVTAVLWHDEVGAWLDYDLINDVKRDYFTPTNLSPLWTGCFNPANLQNHASKVMKYMEKSQVMLNMGGLPSTLEHTGEQWDYPNAWAPLNWIAIIGLNNTGDPWAQRLALEIAQRWVRNNYLVFNATNAMFEKYDATRPGGQGGGGEYEVQLGFGWSNGAALDLMNIYGDKLTAEDEFTDEDGTSSAAYSQRIVVSTTGQLLTGIFVLTISLATGFIGMVLYKSRNHHSAGPSMTNNKKNASGGLVSGITYRRRVAYTELKDLNYD